MMNKELYNKIMEDVAPVVKKAILNEAKRVMSKKYIEENLIKKDGYYCCKDKKGSLKRICMMDGDKVPGLIKHFAQHNFTDFEDIFGNGYINLAYSLDEEKFYGWSRGIYGFGIGSEVKKGHCAYCEKKGEWKAKTLKDARQMAIDYAKNLS